MACTKVLARDYEVSVYDGTEYVKIGGLNSITFSFDKESTETTTFDSEGKAEHLATQRAVTISAEGYYEFDPETEEQDPGQAEVEDLAKEVGCDAYADIKISHSVSGKEKYLTGTFNLSDQGGDNNDPDAWGFEFERSGDTMEADPNE